MYGAAFGAGDAYFRGDDILEGAAEGGLIGAVLGPVTQIKFLGPVLVAGGYAGGIVGVFDALEQDNLQLAAFRALAVYTGLRTFVRPTPEPFTFPPTTGGRLGGGPTRAQNRKIAQILIDRGWTITGGGGLKPEEYLPPLNGTGTKGSNYVDITATKNGRTLRINTIDTLSDGTTATPRESAAAALIRAKTPGDHLVLIPKEGW